MSGRFLSGGSVVVTLLLLLAVVWWEPSAGVSIPSAPDSSTGGASDPARVAMTEAARTLLPDGLHLQPASHGACLFEGYDAQGNPRWHAVFSHLAAPSLTGYAGPIELLTGIDADGKVTGVRLLSHNETPTFVEGIDSDWFLGQFRGRSAGDPLAIGEDVDGITQATITVEAICRGIRACLAALTPSASPTPAGSAISIFRAISGTLATSAISATLERTGLQDTSATATTHGTSAPSTTPPVSPTVGATAAQEAVNEKPWPLVALTLAVLLVLAAPAPLAAFGVGLLLGFGSGQYVSLVHVQLLLRHPDQFWVFPLPVRVLLVLGLVAILLRPRGYCRWFCPLGRTQDALWWLRGRMPSPLAGRPHPSPTVQERGEGAFRTPNPSGASEDRGEGETAARDTTLAGTCIANGSPSPFVTGDQAGISPLEGPSLTDLPLAQEFGGVGWGRPARGEAEPPQPRRGLGRLLLWGGLIGLLVDPRLPLERFEAFGPLFLRGFGPFGLVLALAALAGACLWPRFYCRGLCPLNPLFEDVEQVRQTLGGKQHP